MIASCRRFLRLLAAGSAATLAAPVAAATAAAVPKRRGANAPRPTPAPPAEAKPGTALTEEIRKQKASVEQSLKVVRDHVLPPGSAPAFTFRALKARGKERGR